MIIKIIVIEIGDGRNLQNQMIEDTAAEDSSIDRKTIKETFILVINLTTIEVTSTTDEMTTETSIIIEGILMTTEMDSIGLKEGK